MFEFLSVCYAQSNYTLFFQLNRYDPELTSSVSSDFEAIITGLYNDFTQEHIIKVRAAQARVKQLLPLLQTRVVLTSWTASILNISLKIGDLLSDIAMHSPTFETKVKFPVKYLDFLLQNLVLSQHG